VAKLLVLDEIFCHYHHHCRRHRHVRLLEVDKRNLIKARLTRRGIRLKWIEIVTQITRYIVKESV